MSRFINALLVTPLSDGKSWVIISDFNYEIGLEGSNNRVNVKAGFITDFASVPRILWWAFPKWGEYGNAAVVHDWLYWIQNRTRKEADIIMLEAMEVLNVSKIKMHLIYQAVRIFGTWGWNRNKWDKESGFDRVIKHKNISTTKEICRPSILKRTLDKF